MDINLDLIRRTSEIPRFVMQHEVDSRTLNFTILNNGIAYDLTSKTVTLCMEKPDGELIYNAMTVPVGTAGKCNITLTSQAQAAAGVAKCWVKIVDGASVTYSPQFDLEIREVTDFSGAVESTSEFTALDDALATITGYDARLAAAESDIDDLETANGQNVKLTGNQTVAGDKTFTGTTVLGANTSIGDVSATEIGYVNGVTSAIQTQFTNVTAANNGKIDAAGDLLYGSAADTFAKLAIGLAGKTLQVNAAGTAPEWIKPFKVGNTTYDLATATGTQAITGVGFKPSAIIIFGALDDSDVMALGVYDGTAIYGLYHDYTVKYFVSPNLSFVVSSGNYQVATISALGADGFTLSWTKTGTPTGALKIAYLAMR